MGSWKFLVKSAVSAHEKEQYLLRNADDCDFTRFLSIHPSIEPSVLWKTSTKHNSLRSQFHFLVSQVVADHSSMDNHLCHKCGQFYQDETAHVVLYCCALSEMRQDLWEEITDLPNILIGVNLSLLDEEAFLQTLLGKQTIEVTEEELSSIITIGAKYVYRMFLKFRN